MASAHAARWRAASPARPDSPSGLPSLPHEPESGLIRCSAYYANARHLAACADASDP
jgi:hypothetical protein